MKLFSVIGHFIKEWMSCIIIYVIIIAVLYWITSLMLNKFGQNALCLILGAKKIERNEHVETLKKPVEELIEETKAKGMALPDDIEVRMVNHSEPIAYAIGMNTIVVSSAMAELKEDIFKAKIMAELNRYKCFIFFWYTSGI